MSSSETRVRNRRGQGARLREEIVQAAVDILETTGSPDAITLRAVARQVGIAAPSIYGHFADRDAIIADVVTEGFHQLTRMLTEAAEGSDDVVERLRLHARAYLRFAAEHPNTYQLLFNCANVLGPDAPPISLHAGLEAFSVLVGAIEAVKKAGRSVAGDAVMDSTAVWVALHGIATLRANLQQFPWPDEDVLLDTVIGRLARLD